MKNIQRIEFKYKLVIISACLFVLPAVSLAAPANQGARKLTQTSEVPHSAESEVSPNPQTKDQFEQALVKISAVIENSLQLLNERLVTLQANQVLNTEIKYKLIERTQADIDFLETQQLILNKISNANSLRVVANRLDVYIKNHRSRIEEIRGSYINSDADTKIRQTQEKAKEIISSLHKVSYKLQDAGVDTSKLDSMILTYEETVSSMSFLSTNNDTGAIKTAMRALKTDLQSIISQAQSLIKKVQ